jgi:hypothetical protein
MDMDDNDDPERSYRRGYTHGVWDVIRAVSSRLSAIERARFGEWFRQAREWRLAAMRGESKRGRRPNYARILASARRANESAFRRVNNAARRQSGFDPAVGAGRYSDADHGANSGPLSSFSPLATIQETA